MSNSDTPTKTIPDFEAKLDQADKKVASFEKSLKDFVKTKYASLVSSIEVANTLSAEDEKAMHAAIQDFKKSGSY